MTEGPLRPSADSEVAAGARDLGIPGIFDIHVHFMPDRMQQAVWRHFDILARPRGGRYRTDDAARLRILADLGVVGHTALAYAHKPDMAAWLYEFTLDFAERNRGRCPASPSTPSPRRRTALEGRPGAGWRGLFECPNVLLDWLGTSPRRVLFGTDFPACPHDFTAAVRGIVACGFGDDWLRQVFWGNAAGLLPSAAGQGAATG